MKLHIVPGSPNCRKVQAVAHELQSPVEYVMVDFDSGGHKAPEYLALNPNGLVPTLVDGDLRLWESNAIAQYLADRHGQTALWPEDPARRADVSRWQSWELAHFGRHLATALVERIFKPLMGGTPDEAVATEALTAWAPTAAILDAHLAGQPFVAGEHHTLADFCLACQLPLATLGRIDLSPYPNMRAWLDRLDALPAWRATATPEPLVRALEQATRRHT